MENVEVVPGTANTGAFSSPAITITIASSYFLLWIMGISYLVPSIAKSRSEGPKSPLFMENVEVVPGTDSNPDAFLPSRLSSRVPFPCPFHLRCGPCRLLEVSIASSPSLHRHCPISQVLFDDPTSRLPFDSLTYSACRSYSIH